MLSDYAKKLDALINQTLLYANDPNGERYSRARVAVVVNDVVMDFALKTRMIKEEINIQLKENNIEYDIRALVEDDGTLRIYGFPIRVGFNGSNNPALLPTSLLIIDLFGYSQTDNISPKRWHLDTVSPGKIILFGPPGADGEALPSEENNIQITYIAIPEYISSESSYPDSDIPATFHQAFAYGAAALLLEESEDEELFMKSVSYEMEYNRWIKEAVAESYRGLTAYDDCRPC